MSRALRREFVAIDLETTGLLAEIDRVVEIGAIRFDSDGLVLDEFERRVNPGRPMSRSAQAIHGISDADLADAPPAARVLPDLLDFLGDPSTSLLLAHNAWFDAGFLGQELARVGRPPPGHVIVDTLDLARRVRPELTSHRLDALARIFDLDPQGPHRALADSRRVLGLWFALGGPEFELRQLLAYPIFVPGRSAAVPLGWDPVAEAIDRGWTVRMEYGGGTHGTAPREITPRAFVQRGGVPYLVAICHADDFEKSFRLDRVRWFEVVTLPDSP